MHVNVVKLTRVELYEQIWATPMQTLARKYGLSDVGLAKVCKRFGIPRPPVGYWARKQAGKAAQRPTLPDAEERGAETIALRVPTQPKVPGNHAFFDPILADLHARERQRSAPEMPAEVGPRDRIASHSRQWFIEAARREARWKKDGGVMSGSEHPQHPKDVLTLDVSRNVLERGWAIVAGIEAASADRGYRCAVSAKFPRNMEVEALGGRFYLRIREKLRQVKHELTGRERGEIKRFGRPLFAPKWDLQPTGRLELICGRSPDGWARRTWRDTARDSLEARLHEVFCWMILDLDDQQREEARRKEEARQAAEAARRRREEEERRRREQARRDRLVRDVEAWDLAGRIRRFVDVVESEFRTAVGPVPTDGAIGLWIAWARAVAAEHDLTPAYFESGRHTIADEASATWFPLRT